MRSRGPNWFERLVGYAILVVAVSVLLQEVARLVQAYAGCVMLLVVVAVIGSVILWRFYY